MDGETKSPFFERAQSGGAILVHAFKVLDTYPVLFMPIFICWIFVAAGILYFNYVFDWDACSASETFLTAFLIIMGFTLIYSMAALMLLELLEQLERGRKFSIIAAVRETFMKDLPKALPVIVTWAFIDFCLTVLDVFSRDSKKGGNLGDEFTAENAAKTLAGYENTSIFDLGIEALEKGIRMISFLIFPAIAWEDLSTVAAVKKAFVILRVHTTEFVSGYLTTWAASAIIFLPPGLLFYITDKMGATLPDRVWVATIIYCGVGWSFYLYLEQMFAGLLYLWNKKWEQELGYAEESGASLSLRDVRQPSFLDGIADLN